MGISPTQMLIVLLIVALLFGTKKLRNMGGDLGSAIKGFKKAMNDEDKMLHSEQATVMDKPSDTTTASQHNTAV